jgi:hypothetical protein
MVRIWKHGGKKEHGIIFLSPNASAVKTYSGFTIIT